MNRALLVVGSLLLGGLGAAFGHWFLQASSQGQVVETTGKKAAVRIAMTKEFASYRDVVKKVLPAVVSIDAQAKDAKSRPRDGEVPRDGSPNRVGFGSGFIISARGVVVTNNHVVEGADQVIVQMSDGKKFTSRKIKTDAKTDLAVVELDSKQDLPHLEFGDSDEMEIGDRVLAIGAPFGLSGTVTHGIISSKGRALRMNFYEDFLQTDAAINPGNSGGPLVNLEGKVIGINSAIKSRTGGFQGIGLAISSNLGKRIANSLLKDGMVKRGYLGVGILDVDEDSAKELGLKEVAGVRVTRTFTGAPGEKGGIKKDDVIVTLAKKPIKDGRALQNVVAVLPLGKEVEVEVIRGGKRQTVSVVIEQQPEKFGVARPTALPEIKGPVEIEKVGLVVAELTPEWGERLGYPETARGALVATVNRRGMAGRAGLVPGMLIVSIDGKATTTPQAVSQAIEKGSTVKGIKVEITDPRGNKQTLTLREGEDS